jgi:hypothetical protein
MYELLLLDWPCGRFGEKRDTQSMLPRQMPHTRIKRGEKEKKDEFHSKPILTGQSGANATTDAFAEKESFSEPPHYRGVGDSS